MTFGISYQNTAPKIASLIILIVLLAQIFAVCTASSCHIQDRGRIIYPDNPDFPETVRKLRMRAIYLIPVETALFICFIYFGWVKNKTQQQ